MDGDDHSAAEDGPRNRRSKRSKSNISYEGELFDDEANDDPNYEEEEDFEEDDEEEDEDEEEQQYESSEEDNQDSDDHGEADKDAGSDDQERGHEDDLRQDIIKAVNVDQEEFEGEDEVPLVRGSTRHRDVQIVPSHPAANLKKDGDEAQSTRDQRRQENDEPEQSVQVDAIIINSGNEHCEVAPQPLQIVPSQPASTQAHQILGTAKRRMPKCQAMGPIGSPIHLLDDNGAVAHDDMMSKAATTMKQTELPCKSNSVYALSDVIQRGNVIPHTVQSTSWDFEPPGFDLMQFVDNSPVKDSATDSCSHIDSALLGCRKRSKLLSRIA